MRPLSGGLRDLRHPGVARGGGGQRRAAARRLPGAEGVRRARRHGAPRASRWCSSTTPCCARRSPKRRRWSPSRRVAAEQADEQAADVAGLGQAGVLSKEADRPAAVRRRAAPTPRSTPSSPQLRDLETRDARMTIRAPVGRPGADAQRPAGRHRQRRRPAPMFTIARDSLVELEAQVAEGDMAGIHVGDAVAGRRCPTAPASGVGAAGRAGGRSADQARQGARPPAGARRPAARRLSAARCSPGSCARCRPRRRPRSATTPTGRR